MRRATYLPIGTRSDSAATVSASALNALNRSFSVHSMSVGLVVFGLVIAVLGYLAYRFPDTFRGRSINGLSQPAPGWERAYNRVFAVVFMIAGSAVVVAGLVVVR